MKTLTRLTIFAIAALAGGAAGTAGAADSGAKTLQECVAIALDRHPTLHSVQAAVDAANQRVRQAGSQYLPQLSANYNVDRRNTSTSARLGVSTASPAQTFWFYNTGVSLKQVLFDFGQTLNSIRAAQANERASQADAGTQRATVVLNVKQSYFQLLAANRLLLVADETVTQNQKHLELAEGRFRVGLAPKFDVTQAQVQLATAELNQITARNAVALAQETLRHAIGLSEPLSFEIVDSLDVHALRIDDNAALQAAYTSRPELQGFYERGQALLQQISALKKDYLPHVIGNGTYQWSGSDYPLQSTWDVGAAVTVNIFDGGLAWAQAGETEANLSKLRFDEEAERQSITLEVRQSTLDLHRAEEAISVAEKGVRQARENLALAEGRYRTGVGNIIEVTDAQASRSSAEASHVQTLYSYKTAVAALEKATAKEWESE